MSASFPLGVAWEHNIGLHPTLTWNHDRSSVKIGLFILERHEWFVRKTFPIQGVRDYRFVKVNRQIGERNDLKDDVSSHLGRREDSDWLLGEEKEEGYRHFFVRDFRGFHEFIAKNLSVPEFLNVQLDGHSDFQANILLDNLEFDMHTDAWPEWQNDFQNVRIQILAGEKTSQQIGQFLIYQVYAVRLVDYHIREASYEFPEDFPFDQIAEIPNSRWPAHFSKGETLHHYYVPMRIGHYEFIAAGIHLPPL